MSSTADFLNPCSPYAPLLSAIGVASALSLTAVGAAYGTAKSAMGIIHISVMRPDLMMRCSLPVIMAGIVGLYGLILCIFLKDVFTDKWAFNLGDASLRMAAGLCVGLSGAACGIAIGVVGDAGVRGVCAALPGRASAAPARACMSRKSRKLALRREW
mgnify:CR=1 FL=1